MKIKILNGSYRPNHSNPESRVLDRNLSQYFFIHKIYHNSRKKSSNIIINLTKSQGSKKFHGRLKSHVQIQNHQKDRTNLS